MRDIKLVADKYDIKKLVKYDRGHFGKLVNPRIYTVDGKYFLKADAYVSNCNVGLIDYSTSDYHLFATKQEAINAWAGRKPAGTNWDH